MVSLYLWILSNHGIQSGYDEGFKDAYDLYKKDTPSDAQEGPTIDLNEGTGTTLLPSTSEGSESVVEGSVKTPVKNPTKKTTKK